MATIFIEKETRTKLQGIGRKEQTYDDIIKELIAESKKDSVRSQESTEWKKDQEER